MSSSCTQLRTLLFPLFLFCCSNLGAQNITIEGSHFLLDGEPFDMWGVRLASASQSDENTNKVIHALDEYQEVGINTLSVYLQGSSGGYSDPFDESGREIDQQHWDRLVRLIENCRRRRMVVIVGIFYQRTLANQNSRNINSADAVKKATALVAQKLQPYGNVILNIANEQNSGLYKGFDAFDFNNADNIIELCRLAKEEDPARIVGAGGYHDSLNVVIGQSDDVDALLFDTYFRDIEQGHDSGWHFDHFRAQGVVNKPIVNVELFGGWTKKFLPQGVYTPQGQEIHLAEIKAAKEREGLYVHFHSNPWFQAKDQDLENQFTLGGSGSTTDPGVRWYFEKVPNQAILVHSPAELQETLSHAKPGQIILLAEGEYRAAELILRAKGTSAKPIVVRPQANAEVTILSPMVLEGNHLFVEGLQFAEEANLEIHGTGCRLSQCSFDNVRQGKWVRVLPGSNQIEIDHNTFKNKSINGELERGCQLLQIVVLNKNEQHHIHHNLFKDIPEGSGNGFETLQLITKDNPFDPAPGHCNTVIEKNLFIRCNGESEIISIKSNGNTIRNNTFRACRGSLVLRHGDDNEVAENYFFGQGERRSGGVRIQGSGQKVVNNYFHGLGAFALGMMDGTPDDLYIRVEGAQVLFNSIIDCDKSFVIGLNHSKHPNGTAPKDCQIIGNLFFHQDSGQETIIKFVQDDKPENWSWKGNVAFGGLLQKDHEGIQKVDPHLQVKRVDEYLIFLPSEETPNVDGTKNSRRAVGAFDFFADTPVKTVPLTEQMVGSIVNRQQ